MCEPTYYELEDFELGKCALCQKDLSVAGERAIHTAICFDCERKLSDEDYFPSYLEARNSAL